MATSGAWQPELAPQLAEPATAVASEAPSGMSELGTTPPIPIAPVRRRAVLGPLHEPLFRSLWIAAVISYIGRWMQTVGAGWLMT